MTRYLLGTKDAYIKLGVLNRDPTWVELVGYSGRDWAGDPASRKSQGSGDVDADGSPMASCSRRQRCVRTTTPARAPQGQRRRKRRPASMTSHIISRCCVLNRFCYHTTRSPPHFSIRIRFITESFMWTRDYWSTQDKSEGGPLRIQEHAQLYHITCWWKNQRRRKPRAAHRHMAVTCGGNLALVQTKAPPKDPGDVGRSLEDHAACLFGCMLG